MPWFLPPDPAADRRFREAQEWYDAFDPKPTGQGELILDHARRQYAEQTAAYESIDAKADAMLRFSAALSALIVSAVAGWRLDPAWAAAPSLMLWIVSMVFCLIARNPFIRPGIPPSRQIIDGVPQTIAPEEWMAAGVFLASEELRVLSDWKGATVQRAVIALCCGVILSFLLIFTVHV